jgi:hypothetical protein
MRLDGQRRHLALPGPQLARRFVLPAPYGCGSDRLRSRYAPHSLPLVLVFFHHFAKPWMMRIALAATLALLCAGPASAQHIAFYGVTVVDVVDGTVRPSHTVVVRDGKIVLVAPSIITPVPRGAQKIDAFRHFLIPGLIETSGVLATRRQDYDADDVLAMYASRGVTTVRAPLTDPKQEDLRRRSAEGKNDHPRVLLGPPPAAGQEPSVEDLWKDGTSIPTRPAGLSPLATLRALTIDAAKELGIDAEVGAIRMGARADLILLSADPFESVDALNQIDGVMTFGRWEPAGAVTKDVEEQAREAVRGYYFELPRRTPPVSCHGETLQECFGGDADCPRNLNCVGETVPAIRGRLLDDLDRYGAVGWRSNFIVGQRVNFALKNSDTARAMAAAESCAASLYWCQALRGLVRHRTRAGSGTTQLDSALANTPPLTEAWALPRLPSTGDRGIQCEWGDVRSLLGTRTRMLEDYEREKARCQFETIFDKRFWFLSDPLWTVPGNERRDEHYARNIEMRLHDEILRARKTGNHPRTHQEAVLPGGFPNSWEPRPVPPGRGGVGGGIEGGSGIVYGGYAFTPDEDRFYEPGESTSEDWVLEWDDGRQVERTINERMITVERWFNIDHQTAVLRRGLKLLVMEAGTLPLAIQQSVVTSAALALGRPSDFATEVAPTRMETDGRLRASVEVAAPTPLRPGDPVRYGLWDNEWMTSLEVIAPGLRARSRENARQPLIQNGFGMSDIVLVRDDFETSRATLLDAMLPFTTLSKIQPIGIYFEVYGVSAGERLQFAVAIAPSNLSLAQRLAGALRMRSEDGLDVSWLEAAETPTPGTMTRFVKLELANLAEGPHEILVTVTRADGTVASASRLVRIGP